MMPHLNGFELMEQFKAMIPGNSYLPILVLTADITQEAKQKALSGGAKDFLSKPFDLDEVGIRIKNLLETRYLHQMLENQNQILDEKVKERTFELQKANLELDLANKELKVLDQAKVGFLNLISHEIRTPLNGIKSFTEILKSEIHSPELQEHLHWLESSVVRLEKFSHLALMITELCTRETEIQIGEVQLRDLMARTNILLEKKIKSKNLQIHLQNSSKLNAIPGNRKYIQLCFDYLTDNAVNFSPPDEVVVINVFSDDKFTVCEFTDDGPGFSSDALTNLFKLFWVGDRHNSQNSGLNLALIKLIMDAHHGRIEVCNNQPKGATVRLTFNNIVN
jgi:two-component system sensor histidine kinase/response regulator